MALKKPNTLRAWSYSSNLMIVMGCLPAIPISLLLGEFVGALGALVVLGAAAYDAFNCHALYEAVAEKTATIAIAEQRLRRMRMAQISISVIGTLYFSMQLFSIDGAIARQLGAVGDMQSIQQEVAGLAGNLKTILVIAYIGMILIFVSGQIAILLAYSKGGQKIFSYIQETSRGISNTAQLPPIIIQ